ncbi:helix-turn-helix transcriptional regulator [Streptomyces sp. NPDC091281]|uniref:helix-turn-helix transcriptional regulator n=1 Tax=Streptomyces sp. NPDC091281 TaxID=3365985 RepID=UPI00380B58DA
MDTTMVEAPDGETYAEIAARHGRAESTVRNHWARHPAWPPSNGKKGRRLTFDPALVDQAVAEHIERPRAELEPRRLYTAAEIENLTGVTSATIRADRARDRWPAPDDESDRAHRWYGATVNQSLAGRRAYRRSAQQ